jgi:hypothetical protein
VRSIRDSEVSAPASKRDILRPSQATQSRKGKVKRYFTTFAGDAESKRDILRPSQATQSRREIFYDLHRRRRVEEVR